VRPTAIATLGILLRLVRDTVLDPREGAATVLAFAPPRQALWLMFALVIVLTIMMVQLGELMVAPLPDGDVLLPGIQLGMIQAVILFVVMHAIHHIGRIFGGTGQFAESMLLVIWLQFIMLCLQVVQFVALILAPPLALVVTLMAVGLVFWLLVNFIATLHGFQSLGRVCVMVILSTVGIAFLVSLVLAVLGVSIPEGYV